MIIGIIFGLYLKTSVVLFICLLVYLIIAIKYKKTEKKAIAVLLISILLSSMYLKLLNNKYEKFYCKIQDEIELEAVIVSEAKQTKYYKSYNIKARDKKFILYTKENLEYGTLIKVKGNFIEPNGARNYKGFNYKQYLKSKKIYGSIKSEEIEILEKDKVNIIQKSSNNVRNKIIQISNKILPEDTRGLLQGILIGNKDEIPEEITDNFRKSSLSHILAISGTHISYIILGITYILTKSKIPRRMAYYITDLSLIFFMFITGFTPSVVRASIMGILLITSKLVYRKADVLNSMAISLIIILINNPFSIQDIGLQLSYLGTLGIILLNNPIAKLLSKKIPEKIAKMASVTISAQILILPITILKFNTISLTFLISNIIAVPLAGIIILYGYINIFVGIFSLKLANIFAIILNILLKSLITISELVAKIPFSNILIPTPNLIYIILYYLIIIKFKKRKILVILFIIILAIDILYIILPKDLRINVIDVGQGDSTLIITPKNQKILIDSGEEENVLLNYLLDRQIMKIDYILISHFDSDHCFNFIEVIENLKVENLIISKQIEKTELFTVIMDLCNKHKVNVIVVEAGQTLAIEKDINLKILWPTKTSSSSINENSIVSKIEYNNFSMLFTGDIGKESEKELLEKYQESILKSTILKVAHHGSKNSSIVEFLNAVQPKISVIGVGRNNKFGHPAIETIEKLEKIKSQIFRTDLNGEINIKINKNGKIKINCMNM